MDRVLVGDLVVDSVEYIFQVTLGVYHGKFLRVEKSSGIQPVHCDKVSPLRTTVGEIESSVHGTKRTVRRGDCSMWSGHTLPGARSNLNHQAGLIAKLGGRRTGYDFERLDGGGRNLVGKNLALLVRDRLTVNGEGVLRMITESVEKPVGIGGNSRRHQGN